MIDTALRAKSKSEQLEKITPKVIYKNKNHHEFCDKYICKYGCEDLYVKD